jgi:NAD(P)-dependent dehydrogenase (short-subunit alcohol dehydrogenase family)
LTRAAGLARIWERYQYEDPVVQSRPGETMSDLSGKVAVVTGGARGIGRAIAELFVRSGATVVIGDIRSELGTETAKALSSLGPITAAPLDVRDWSGVSAFFEQVLSTYGQLDVCVNNAGVQAIAASLEMTERDWNEVMAVNLSGVFVCAREAGRVMGKRGGSIINMSSAAGVLALPGRAPYCSTKAGVSSLTRVLAVEWTSLRIRVNAIGPGWVETDLVRDAIQAGKLSADDIRRRTPLDRLARPEEIAQVALFLASDRSSYITGQTIYPDGGFTSYGGWR